MFANKKLLKKLVTVFLLCILILGLFNYKSIKYAYNRILFKIYFGLYNRHVQPYIHDYDLLLKKHENIPKDNKDELKQWYKHFLRVCEAVPVFHSNRRSRCQEIAEEGVNNGVVKRLDDKNLTDEDIWRKRYNEISSDIILRGGLDKHINFRKKSLRYTILALQVFPNTIENESRKESFSKETDYLGGCMDAELDYLKKVECQQIGIELFTSEMLQIFKDCTREYEEERRKSFLRYKGVNYVVE